ncbi:MAG: M3 family oligoendopeptidase [Candidatus Pacearchaeota archaeon]
MLNFKKEGWNLGEILPGTNNKRIFTLMKKISFNVKNFEKYKEKIKPTIKAEKFFSMLKDSEKIAGTLARLEGYTNLNFYTDTSNPLALKLKKQTEQFCAEKVNQMLFFDFFWKKLDDKNAKRILRKAGTYRYFLKNLRKFRKYILKEEEEKIINIKDVTGKSVLGSLYSILTSKFLFEMEEKGKKKKFTRDQLTKFIYSNDKEVRKKAYLTLYVPFKQEKEIISEIYRAIVLDWKNENINLRGFKKAISIVNLNNDVPDEAVENLFYSCKKNVSIFQNYFKLKAKILGIQKFSRYDIYAPVGKPKEYNFNEAMRFVLDSFRLFNEDFYKNSLKLFKNKHVDSEARKGKRTGAFNFSIVPDLLPYVSINFAGHFKDIFIVAHELGHAVHGIFASRNSFFNFHPPLPLAEISSIFAEMLVYDYLFKKSNLDFKKYHLFSRLDDLYATIQRQAFFSIFEEEAHKKMENSSMHEIAEIYKKNLKQQFGNSLILPDDFRWEWLTIPHFYEDPFYCYSYAFSNLLVLSLYERYKKEGKDFIPVFLDLLRAGGSQEPEKLLAKHGFKIRSTNFWKQGFKLIEGLVKEAKNVG